MDIGAVYGKEALQLFLEGAFERDILYRQICQIFFRHPLNSYH